MRKTEKHATLPSSSFSFFFLVHNRTIFAEDFFPILLKGVWPYVNTLILCSTRFLWNAFHDRKTACTRTTWIEACSDIIVYKNDNKNKTDTHYNRIVSILSSNLNDYAYKRKMLKYNFSMWKHWQYESQPRAIHTCDWKKRSNKHSISYVCWKAGIICRRWCNRFQLHI